ncbi:MAG: endonuclease/exonuclease/phosphatase [Chitinophagaceae bacterium]|nr:endonuclease/exonuclease/phosphatase [Chitinophagaceae bacterium]
MKKAFILNLLVLFCFSAIGQKKDYKPVIVAFYNLENLFDTLDNTMINDEEFLPSGPRNYNGSIYFDKLTKLATVISEIGTEMNADGPAILGVAEVENDTVLNDLVKHKLIKDRGYKIVHYDSKDARGIDVGLLYNPKYFTVEASDKLYVQLPGGSKDAYYTRDVLWVKGKLDGETIHIYVNHWPSRSGGEKRSAPGRNAAAQVCKNHIDSIAKIEPNAKIVIMGDLNDDPINESVAKILGAKPNAEDVIKGGLYNPWTELYKKGYGTLAYQDAWGLFDQIIISYPWLSKGQDGLFFQRQHIFNKEYLVENNGRYKGYPMRTWDGNTYRGGYSDHFPTYLVMLKEVKPEKKSF